jgi:hypothetical protein
LIAHNQARLAHDLSTIQDALIARNQARLAHDRNVGTVRRPRRARPGVAAWVAAARASKLEVRSGGRRVAARGEARGGGGRRAARRRARHVWLVVRWRSRRSSRRILCDPYQQLDAIRAR